MFTSCSLAETDDPAASGFSIPVLEVGARTVSIDSVQAPELTQQTVVLRGQVQQRVPILGGWLYELQDETGGIWVVAPQSPPEVGSTLTVEGSVQYKEISNGVINQGEYYLQQIP
ncbi:hypothetical protein IQ241_09225 [Romeria aff. gracilis LEGE 07310]|uniref:OB-fold nucleic acid binding domain protein n=1 Tax=Vasconcelosia minhoensis LEGE 07310 TaxID=915328 RepID=A0A8J7A6B5_9CYAN|nr:hypothetical protein [Romeria gracilis]MBE9077477.1 hypothetical protein [Romeria aff. gracilis LEGE 07310]